MREIKFRVWEVSNLPSGATRERMITNEELISWGHIPSPMLPTGFLDVKLEPGERWAWMQYTGLKDKNGREIYEGDILAYSSIDFHKNNYQVRHEVRFGEYDNGEEYDDRTCGCGWWLKGFLLVRSNGETDTRVEVYDYQGLYGLENMEVIGNIYENREEK